MELSFPCSYLASGRRERVVTPSKMAEDGAAVSWPYLASGEE
jgi:hypothetical protein